MFEDINYALVLQEILHSSPMLLIIGTSAWKFVRGHMKSMKQIEESVMAIKLSLAEANIPELKKDVDEMRFSLDEHFKVIAGLKCAPFSKTPKGVC